MTDGPFYQHVHAAGTQLFPDGSVSPRYAFMHALYHEVFYGRLAPGRRARLHRRIGARLEALYAERSSSVASELAHHFEAGADWPRAVKHLRLVAEIAGRRYAHREAVAIVQHALALVSHLPEAERGVAETEILEKLAAMYLVSFDRRTLETYEALAARAAHYGLLAVEVRALIDMAYPLSWISSERSLEVLERALRLSAAQGAPLLRARTRASCFFWRIEAGGWNPRHAEECQKALAEIRQAGDRRVLALHLIDYSFIQCTSSAYRDAHRSVVESLVILFEGGEENPYLSLAYHRHQFIVPRSLLFVGEWGEALHEIDAGLTMAEKNGDAYRMQRFRLYRAWVHFHAMDFAGALALCESVLPFVGDPGRIAALRSRGDLVLTGSAEVGLGNYERALEYLWTAREDMERQIGIFDWYWRMPLELGLTELWLAKGDLPQARLQAERVLEVTLGTAERTWQALAWDANARVALAERDLQRAQAYIAEALTTMEGFEVPLAAWRVHATAAELYEHTGNSDVAAHYRARSRATILQLAHSLPVEEPLRNTFLSAPCVSKVLGDTGHGVDMDFC
jgi:tetratricopeptide (TPR) repeat protein